MLLLSLLLACTSPAPPAVAPAPPEPAPVAAPPVEAPPPPPWPPDGFVTLEPGLELGAFDAGRPSLVGDGRVTVLRVDPARFELELLASSREHPGELLDGPGWAARHGLLAVINAGMFAQDYSTAVFALIDEDSVNNGTIAAGAGSVMLLEPRAGDIASARLLDHHCDDLEALCPAYASLVQSYRLLDCGGQPAWQPSHKIWSHAVVGMDRDGLILFIHARSPWSTRDFTGILLDLPLELTRLHYGEGGPEATLHLVHGERSLTLVGSYETGFVETDDNHRAWALPNIIAVRRRD